MYIFTDLLDVLNRWFRRVYLRRLAASIWHVPSRSWGPKAPGCIPRPLRGSFAWPLRGEEWAEPTLLFDGYGYGESGFDLDIVEAGAGAEGAGVGAGRDVGGDGERKPSGGLVFLERQLFGGEAFDVGGGLER